MSGHSKWATIKRKKGAKDAARGKLFTKLNREVAIAARIGGGDEAANPRLRKAILTAKSQGVPADGIQRAINRGTGEVEGAVYEELVYEGTGPGGTLFMVEGATDNRNRTAPELRKLFERHNGQMGQSGTAGWAFDHLGSIVLDKAKLSEEQLMELAVEAGAEDYRDEGDVWVIYTPIVDLDTVTSALEAAKVEVRESSLVYLAKNKKPVEGRDAEVCLNLFEALDDHDDVQNVYADFDISDAEMARIAGDD
jgi:YebC/PmpR family DNA-binding regulatory protein